MKIKLKREYLGASEGSIIEAEHAEAELLVGEKRAEYLQEIPKARNKVIKMRGKRKYKPKRRK